ncbi:MlaD family protein [Nocardia salmonicida]|uniref:MlaD family protein n=1 Tax=Nocardia salmonicida TaxID=53431 RepID=UPI00343B1872
MKPGAWFSLLGIAVISTVGIAYLTFGVIRFEPGRSEIEAKLVVPNAAGLQVGSPILLRGIEVGSVTGMSRARSAVDVDFTVNTRFRIPIDSTVVIEGLSALGEPYVMFEPRSENGPYLTQGQVVHGEKVTTPLSIPQVAHLVAQAMNQLDPRILDRLLDTAELALRGTDEVVPRLSRSTDLIAAMLVSRADTFGAMLTDLQQIAPDMEWTGPAFEAAAPRLTEFAERVGEIADAVGRLVQTGDTPRMYQQGNGLVPFLAKLRDWVNEAGPDIAAMAPALQPLAASAASAVPQVDLSALIASAAAASGPPGALHLRINVK